MDDLSDWGSEGLQEVVRAALSQGVQEVEYHHKYGWDQETHYVINLVAMTSTNPDSQTVRAMRVVCVLMW